MLILDGLEAAVGLCACISPDDRYQDISGRNNLFGSCNRVITKVREFTLQRVKLLVVPSSVRIQDSFISPPSRLWAGFFCMLPTL